MEKAILLLFWRRNKINTESKKRWIFPKIFYEIAGYLATLNIRCPDLQKTGNSMRSVSDASLVSCNDTHTVMQKVFKRKKLHRYRLSHIKAFQQF